MSKRLAQIKQAYEHELEDTERDQLIQRLEWRSREVKAVEAALNELRTLRVRLESQLLTESGHLQRIYEAKTMKDIPNEIRTSLRGIDVTSQAAQLLERKWRPLLTSQGYSRSQIDTWFTEALRTSVTKPRPI